MKKIYLIILFLIVFATIVAARTFTPYGNIDLQNFYTIINGTNISMSGLLTTGDLIALGNVSIRGNLSVDGNFSVDGSTFFVDATNNRVGIGTTSPATALDVAGDITIGANKLKTTNLLFKEKDSVTFQIRNADDTADRGLYMGKLQLRDHLSFVADARDFASYSSNTGYSRITAFKTSQIEIARMQGDASDPYFSLGGSQDFKFYNSGYLTFPGSGTIDVSGNVGIGTASPIETLTIIGNLSVDGNLTRVQNISAINYLNSSGGLKWIKPENIYDVDYENICSGDACPFAFNISGTNVFPQMADWNVGIGTSSPTEKLEVIGNLSATESTYIGTGTGWLDIFLEGITGFFDSTYAIMFTNDVYINKSLNVTGNFTGNQIYGGWTMHDDTGVVIDLVTSSIYKNITGFNFSRVNGFRVDSNYSLSALIDGTYEVGASVSFKSASGAEHGLDIGINGLAQNVHGHRQITTSAAEASVSLGPYYISLVRDDNVTLMIRDEAGAVSDPTIIAAQFGLTRVGD